MSSSTPTRPLLRHQSTATAVDEAKEPSLNLSEVTDPGATEPPKPWPDLVPFYPCTATAAFFLFAHKNLVYCLHHDTFALERTLTKHKANIAILNADNISENTDGRLAVSYDKVSTAIVWDLFTGAEVSRFASYEFARVISWLRDGRLAFGDGKGDITIYEPTSTEHITFHTIFDPVNGISSSPCGTMLAVGYQNGTVLVASLADSLDSKFTILHSLAIANNPVPITDLAWHGTVSKQKTEMLAAQTMDGNLRVWGIPKEENEDIARIIRIINPPAEMLERVWFSWSKNGRVIQYCDGDTRAWDVRTKNINYNRVPTVDGIIGLTLYGPSGTLFTITRNWQIQQYDLVSHKEPRLISNIPVRVAIDTKPAKSIGGISEAESSDAEGSVRSPLQKLIKNTENYEDEARDRVGPLSPASSRASMTSSSSYGRRQAREVAPPRQPSVASERTIFSSSTNTISRQSNRSRRSRSGSAAPIRTRSSALRQEILRSPEGTKVVREGDDLFPSIRARLQRAQLKIPQYGQSGMSVRDLQKEMLNVIFDWSDDPISLVRFEQVRHRKGSVGSVLLSRWLGNSDTDTLTQTIGSESMTASDWMLLALSSQMGQGSQRAVGEAFVRRLLEQGEVHQAVAILLVMDEQDVAVEVYSTRHCFLEAVLLNSVVRPEDWYSQSQLLRRWGEKLVADSQTESALRCFSCASMTPAESYASSSADDSATESDLLSTPISPPNAEKSSRLAAINAPLKLITNFSDRRHSQQSGQSGRTPMPDTIISLDAGETWRDQKSARERSESRTATPGHYGSSRMPSAGPRTASGNRRNAGSKSGSRSSSQRPEHTSSATRTPSTVRTARPAAAELAVIRGERNEANRSRNHGDHAGPKRIETPDISITETSSGMSLDEELQDPRDSPSAQSGTSSFLDEASSRVSHFMSVHSAVDEPEQSNFDPLLAAETQSQSKSKRSHRRGTSDSLALARSMMSTPPIDRPGSANSSLRQISDLTTLDKTKLTKKELAALELEERRRSLLRRPSIPPIPHPRELVPLPPIPSGAHHSGRMPEGDLLPATTYVRGLSIERSVTADPAYLNRRNVSPELQQQGEDSPSSSKISPQKSGRHVAISLDSAGGMNSLESLLPATTYQRPPLARSVSAPPVEVPDRTQHRRSGHRQANIDTIHEAPAALPSKARPSHASAGSDSPILPELAHLTVSASSSHHPLPPPPPSLSINTTAASTGESDTETDTDGTTGIVTIGTDDPSIASPAASAVGRTSHSHSRRPSFDIRPQSRSQQAQSHQHQQIPHIERAATMSPSGSTASASVSGSPSTSTTTSTTLAGKWHAVSRRLRSGSHSQSHSSSKTHGGNGGSPSTSSRGPMPYETVLETLPATQYEHRGRGGGGSGAEGQESLQRGVSPASAMQGYRNPKEIRDRLARERERERERR